MTAPAASAAPSAPAGPAFLNDVQVLAERDFKRSFSKVALFGTVVQPLVFFGIFYATFSGMLADKGIDYGPSVTPTLVVQALMFIAIASAMALATDRGSGLFNRLRTMPISSSALGAARLLTVAVEAVISTVVIALVAHLAGFRFHEGPLAAIGFLLVAVLFTMALAAVTATLGLTVRSQEALAACLYLPYLPLLVVSTGFVPANLFPGWLQPVVNVSPVSAVVEALRALSDSSTGTGRVWPALVWCAGLILLCGWTTARAFRKVTK
ncbi:ABC transporter permease [Streptomyces xanthochromogenes]|uniref:Transport permease protein n=1 Tax=Streptomyces xanthochromogenes TaxID=67384 RepID=A0ABQ2ZNL7_9ACTN|nr:ABC transporter permease [Streptomyces xanthochromogenes]GGY18284.1 doxorubicin resistance ABC transporter permease DrrB [Streptomyces xanthochromogenes]